MFEMVLKFYGLGVHMYFKSSFNIFDCVVSISPIFYKKKKKKNLKSICTVEPLCMPWQRLGARNS